MNSEISRVIDMNERDLEKLSKAELIRMVQKLQKKAKKPKIVIADDKFRHLEPTNQFQLLGPTKQLRNLCLNLAMVPSKWSKHMKT